MCWAKPLPLSLEAELDRRLAAIFALDMVGYSRLMEADEADTLARQNTIRTDLVDPSIKDTPHGELFEAYRALGSTEIAYRHEWRPRLTGIWWTRSASPRKARTFRPRLPSRRPFWETRRRRWLPEDVYLRPKY